MTGFEKELNTLRTVLKPGTTSFLTVPASLNSPSCIMKCSSSFTVNGGQVNAYFDEVVSDTNVSKVASFRQWSPGEFGLHLRVGALGVKIINNRKVALEGRKIDGRSVLVLFVVNVDFDLFD